MSDLKVNKKTPNNFVPREAPIMKEKTPNNFNARKLPFHPVCLLNKDGNLFKPYDIENFKKFYNDYQI